MIRRPQSHVIGGGKLMPDYRGLSLIIRRSQIHLIGGGKVNARPMFRKRKGKYAFFLHLMRIFLLNDTAPFVPLVKAKRGKETAYEAKTLAPAGRRYVTLTEMQCQAAARRRLEFPLSHLGVNRTVEDGREKMGERRWARHGREPRWNRTSAPDAQMN